MLSKKSYKGTKSPLAMIKSKVENKLRANWQNFPSVIFFLKPEMSFLIPNVLPKNALPFQTDVKCEGHF